MVAISTYLENALLAEVLTNVAYTGPTTVYLALYTTNPTAADSGTEVTGGSYARAAATFTVPSGGVTVNTADINIANMPAITVSYLGLRTALTSGNLLFYGALTVPRTTVAGDTFTVRAGDLSVALT